MQEELQALQIPIKGSYDDIIKHFDKDKVITKTMDANEWLTNANVFWNDQTKQQIQSYYFFFVFLFILFILFIYFFFCVKFSSKGIQI